MNLKELRTDAAKENGVWIQFDDETRFKLASRSRPEFTRAYEKARKKIPGFKRDSAESNMTCLRTAVGEACVLGWENVKDGETVVDFTPANVEMMLKIPAIFDWVVMNVTDVTNFQAEATAEDAETLKSGFGVES
jgi:hypothetical protein